MIITTFLGKIPGPVIYGALEDKYSKSHPSFAWKVCLCYFYFGFIIVIFLCIFKLREKSINNPEVKLEEQVVAVVGISSGTDANDLFRIEIPMPKKRSKTNAKKIIHENELYNFKEEEEIKSFRFSY